METTEGHLLGGRVRYAQPLDGYRTGIEPVLLAAAIPARPGQRVLEAGAGAGAGLLCLAARIGGVRGIGVEIDPEMAALARRNVSGVSGLEIVTADVTAMRLEPVDHAFANPPWHDSHSTASPVARRRLAKQGDVLEAWIAALARMLAPGGTLSLVLPAGQTARCVAALDAAALGCITVIPLIPKLDRPAKLVITRGEAGVAAVRMSAGLVLHDASGRYTDQAEAILRHGAALPDIALA